MHSIHSEEVDDELYITLDHPMDKAHHIAFAAFVHDDRLFLQRLYAEQDAAFRMPRMRRGGNLCVYCTVDGLFRTRLC